MGVTGEALGGESVSVLVCELGRGHGRGSLLTRERQAAEWKLGAVSSHTERVHVQAGEEQGEGAGVPSAMTVEMGKQRFWKRGSRSRVCCGVGTVVGLAKVSRVDHDAADTTRRRGQSAVASSQCLAISRLRLRPRNRISNTRDCLHHYIPFEC
jgi:hypothetical protein